MGTLRLLETATPGEGHKGEVFGCACSADGAFVLSGGWDGFLRLWEGGSGAHLIELAASPRPLSSCAFSPDGRQWLAGSMEGLLTIFDSVSHQVSQSFVAHTRPISAITYAPDGNSLATASWDRQVALRRVGKEREARILVGHGDIVAGCRFTVDGQQLLSWSYDGTLKLWELEFGREAFSFNGHRDRVTTAALSPDGQWALSGGRDETVRLWDLDRKVEAATVSIGAEVRVVQFLLDAETVFVADAAGRLFLLSLPRFEVQAQLDTHLKVQCADLCPSGMLLVLGGEDGKIHLCAIEGLEGASLVVTPRQHLKPTSSLFGRLMGSTKLTRTYEYTCPTCRHSVESETLPSQPVTCQRCRRWLRVSNRVQMMPVS